MFFPIINGSTLVGCSPVTRTTALIATSSSSLFAQKKTDKATLKIKESVQDNRQVNKLAPVSAVTVC